MKNSGGANAYDVPYPERSYMFNYSIYPEERGYNKGSSQFIYEDVYALEKI